MSGVNLDANNPAGCPSPAEIKAAGFGWVRLVSRPEALTYVLQLTTAGIKVLAVLAQESKGYVVPGATMYQVGNESDTAGPSSWSMSTADYLGLWTWFRDKHPGLPAITSGLASGHLGWWAAVAPKIQGAQGFAVHPYAKDALDARILLSNLKALSPALPLWVTEWNRPVAETRGFADMLASEAAQSMYFCWSDGMVPGFGLTDGHKDIFRSLAPKGPAPMALDVSAPMVAKMAALGDKPILDSTWRTNKDGTGAEVTQGIKGLYISSESDGWTLRGPFVPAL